MGEKKRPENCFRRKRAYKNRKKRKGGERGTSVYTGAEKNRAPERGESGGARGPRGKKLLGEAIPSGREVLKKTLWGEGKGNMK